MDSFVIEPNGPLSGRVAAGGAKNSALKLMAACLLAEGRHVLSNVPRIADVDIMGEVLVALGATAARAANGDLVIDTPSADGLRPEAPYELVEKMRASVVVLGPLLARCGHARVSMPGGDDFGHRPIDIHLNGLAAMGARIETAHGYVEASVLGPDDGTVARLTGTRVVLDYPTHTGTENLLMAAVLAEGTTVIDNAAREPEVADLAAFLNAMGARVQGAGTSRIEVEGVAELTADATPHTVVTDRVVTATYLAAVGLAGGEIVLEDARADHLDMLLRKLGDAGMEIEQGPAGLRAASRGKLESVDVVTLPYPGVATDYLPLLVTMLTVAEGVGIVSENLFSGRFRYVDELRRMGADIKTEGHHAVVRGVPRLSGAPVRAPDIRAGAALVLAGLVAEGETVVRDAYHVDRGYEDLAGTLRALGAPGDQEVTSPGTRVGDQPAELLADAANGNRVALARLLSLVERGGAPSRQVAKAAYRTPPPYTVGLTGAPGAGKSTLTDRLIVEARKGWGPADAGGGGDTGDAAGDGTEPIAQVGVLAVDPTSPFTGGAILGDRVRMQEHALDPTVFIRSMATRGHLGGLSLAVPDGVRLLGAAGFPVVLVETVGVGQMEVEVAAQADTTVVVVTPGWGDSMQANKAGLLEVADLFVINKADRPGARDARRDLEQMLDLSPPFEWRPPVLDTSATSGEGVAELWAAIGLHRRFLHHEGRLERRRAERLTHELRRALMARIEARVGATAGAPSFDEVRTRVLTGELDPYEAADLLLDSAQAPGDT